MSEDNVELVKDLYRGIDRDERFPDPLLADEIEYVNPPDAVEPGIRHGREAFHAAIDRVREVFGAGKVEVERLVDSGDDVVALVTFVVTGQGSGLEQRQPQGHIWTLRDGKAIRFQWFNDQGRALKAAGIET